LPFLEEIATFFENNINDDRILSYIYIYLGFQLIKCNKFEWVTILFYKVNDLAKSKKFIELEFTTLFNLGLINYSMNYFVEGIHNFETALKIIKINKLSIDYSLSIHENLALANINVLKFIHAFINTKEAIRKQFTHKPFKSVFKFYNRNYTADRKCNKNRNKKK